MRTSRMQAGLTVMGVAASQVCLFANPGVVQAAAAPVVTITGPAQDRLVPRSGAPFTGTAADPEGVALVRIYVFDETRGSYTVQDARAAYQAATGTWSFAVQGAHVTAGGFARLWVQAVDGAGHASEWQLRRLEVEGAPVQDLQGPAVTITVPAQTGQLLPAEGFLFEGSAGDASGIGQVRIYVFDETRGSYTVQDARAAYQAATGTWSFAVQGAHVTAGGFARLWVQAVDGAGHASEWKLSRVVITASVERLGPSQVSVQGTRLYLSCRLRDGSLTPPKPFKVRGVNYSPVDPGESVDSLGAARRHLRESRYEEDFGLMRELGANALRTYADFGQDHLATQILNAAYEQDLMVMVTLIDLNPAEVEALVNAYKSHPALLGWLVGNEWNVNLFFDPARYRTVLEAAAAVEQTTQLIHRLDASHPVASGLGFFGVDQAVGPQMAHGTVAQILQSAPSVDIWAFNIYRAGSFEPFFAGWNALRQATGFPGPFFFTEFGTDAWNRSTGQLDEALQAQTDEALWDEIHRHLSFRSGNPPCIGGFVMEWNDEWWKAGVPASQEPNGFLLEHTVFQPATGLPIATLRGHPDSMSNEEYYGLVDIGRRRKPVFEAMRRAFALGTVRVDPVPIEVTSVGQGNRGYTVLTKRGLPAYVGLESGFHMGVVSRSTGTLEEIQRFDTAAAPLQQCPSMLDYVRALKPGDIIVAAVAQTGVSGTTTMGSTAMAPCAQAIQHLGGQRALQIGPEQPWALIAVAGGSPINLAEALGSVSEVVRISTDVRLDADRDGTEDHLDADNDNDGMSDEVERLQGTDVLDPSWW